MGPAGEMALWGHAWLFRGTQGGEKEEEAAQEQKVEMAKQREWAGGGTGNGASGAITFLILSL